VTQNSKNLSNGCSNSRSRATNANGSANTKMEFLVFGLGDWIAPPAYLDGALGEPTAMPFWPHLVLTDVYEDQERSLPVTDEEVEALPGYKFAVKCGKMGIPCVAFTAQAAAIGERFKALWFP
jgi:hypothetical protein